MGYHSYLPDISGLDEEHDHRPPRLVSHRQATVLPAKSVDDDWLGINPLRHHGRRPTPSAAPIVVQPPNQEDLDQLGIGF